MKSIEMRNIFPDMLFHRRFVRNQTGKCNFSCAVNIHTDFYLLTSGFAHHRIKMALAQNHLVAMKKGVPAGTPPITGLTSFCDLIVGVSITYIGQIVNDRCIDNVKNRI